MQLRQRRDDGFTLIELVVTVAIMGIIVTALTGVVISYLKTTVDTQARLTESQDVQLAATYWQRDVASIGVRGYDATTKSFPLEQSVGVTPSCSLPGTPVVTLAWSEYTSLDSTAPATTITVSYVAQSATAPITLLRVRCTGSTVDSTLAVAHNLNIVPTVDCDGDPGCSIANIPRTIKLYLSVLDPEGHGTAADAYTSTLTGERRQT